MSEKTISIVRRYPSAEAACMVLRSAGYEREYDRENGVSWYQGAVSWLPMRVKGRVLRKVDPFPVEVFELVGRSQ